MTEVTLEKLSGGTASVGEDALAAFESDLRGTLVKPEDTDFDEVRAIWNAMIDKRPGLIVRCQGASDVIASIKFAREHDALVSIRSAGHNIAGNALCDGGMTIDLSLMKSVRVEPSSGIVHVEPGATLGDLDKETQSSGRVVPVGINSTTGVAGLTLGGGFGWTSRKYGMSVDNLRAVDVVTAEGELVHANDNENSDLFWAVRGGGGNFGVVTAFEFDSHPVGTEVLSGLIVHPQSEGKKLLEEYRQFVATAPDELTAWVVLRKAPPLPFLPEEVHGTDIFIFAVCYVGDMAEGEKALEPLRKLGSPHADVIAPHRWIDWQAAFDPLLTPGARNYWKSHDFTEIGDESIDLVLDYAGKVPTPECEIFIAHVGGAINRIAEDATAYPHRDAEFVLNVHTRWQEATQDDACVQWARDFFDATAKFATGGVYVNFMPNDEGDRVTAAYTGNMSRLTKVKGRYDPQNVFRCNHNIQPAA